jgi:hypothetical protein
MQRVQGSAAFRNLARIVLICGPDPQTPGRFLMALDKNNLSAPIPALAYQISARPGPFDVGHLTWDSQPVQGDADQLLAVRKTTPQERRNEAVALLVEMLKDGPRPAAEVELAAENRGIPERTLNRARVELGVVAKQERTKEGKLGPSYLQLDENVRQSVNPMTALNAAGVNF